jgi:hypothetical protein
MKMAIEEIIQNIGTFVAENWHGITFGTLCALYAIGHLAAVHYTGEFLKETGYFDQFDQPEEPQPARKWGIKVEVYKE